ncbi:ribonuclease Z [[Eubacterium] cellulosolvens]
MELIFLGTGGSMPTKYRGLPSVVLRRGSELLMFDCGEATQRQMSAAKLGFNKKMRIFISHMHGDHVLGLPGLFQSMSFLGREKKLEIFGPDGIQEFIKAVNDTVKFNQRFDLEVNPIVSGKILDTPEYTIIADKLEHGIECLGFTLIEKEKPGRFDPEKARNLQIPEGPLWKKLQGGGTIIISDKEFGPKDVLGQPRSGSKITYVTDTRPCNSALELAKNATILIHDSTFDNSKSDKAKECGHSTAQEAAKVAKKAQAQNLVLFHISAMYEDASHLLEEARKIFQDTNLAHDLMKLPIKNP